MARASTNRKPKWNHNLKRHADALRARREQMEKEREKVEIPQTLEAKPRQRKFRKIPVNRKVTFVNTMEFSIFGERLNEKGQVESPESGEDAIGDELKSDGTAPAKIGKKRKKRPSLETPVAKLSERPKKSTVQSRRLARRDKKRSAG